MILAHFAVYILYSCGSPGLVIVEDHENIQRIIHPSEDSKKMMRSIIELPDTIIIKFHNDEGCDNAA